MQINMANLNADMRVATNNHFTQRPGGKSGNQGAGNVFGAQCRVTISREGRKLSEESKQSSAQGVQAAQAERLLLREQKQSSDYKDAYSRILDELNGLKNAINSVGAAEDKETVEKKQAALDKMAELKKQQEEENERRRKEAAGNAADAAKQQTEIDRKNTELYIMLKSFEEREEDGSGSAHRTDSEEEEQDGTGGIGEQIQESASMLGVSAARREMQAKGVIGELEDEGLALLSQVNGMVNDIYAMMDDAKQAMNDDSLSDEEKMRRVSEAGDRAKAAVAASFGDMARMQAKGLQMRQDARELGLRHIEINPLDGVAGVQRDMMNLAADAALGEVAQKALDDHSQELEDRVQEEIDRRNDITVSPKEDEEEEKTAEELEQEELQQEKTEQSEEENQ